MYTHIVVPLDESLRGETILPHVEALARKFEARVTLLHVTPLLPIMAATAGDGATMAGTSVDPTPVLEAEARSAAEYLAPVAEELRGRGLKADWKVLEGGAADSILTFARESGGDLIAMTTRGRAGLERALLGSVADSVVRHSPCPVLVVRSNEEPSGG